MSTSNGSCSLGGVGWDGTSQTVPFHPNWTWIMLSGWDVMGRPRLSHAIPMVLGDGMDSWDHALWVGWDGTSQTVPCHPNGTWGWDGQLGSCSPGGMGWDVPDCPIPSQLDLDHALWVGWDGTSQTVPCRPNGTWGWDGQLGSCSLGGMGWDVPDCPIPSQLDLDHALWVGWDGTSQTVPCHPNGTWGWDGQLGSCSPGGMGWDVPDCPIPSQWYLGMGWTAGIMLSGWDGMGRPRLSRAIPMGLGDGMDSWGHALWVGWDGTSQTVPCRPNGTWGWDGQLGSCSLGGMGWDVPDCPIPSQLDLDHAL